MPPETVHAKALALWLHFTPVFQWRSPSLCSPLVSLADQAAFISLNWLAPACLCERLLRPPAHHFPVTTLGYLHAALPSSWIVLATDPPVPGLFPPFWAQLFREATLDHLVESHPSLSCITPSPFPSKPPLPILSYCSDLLPLSPWGQGISTVSIATVSLRPSTCPTHRKHAVSVLAYISGDFCISLSSFSRGMRFHFSACFTLDSLLF